MAYGAGGAYRLDMGARGAAHERARPQLGVVEGGGADALARQGVPTRVLTRARAIVVVVAALTFLGVARVSITTATVGVLRENRTLEGAISEAEDANSSLRVERSILSSSKRVERIATQNLGMVPADERDVVSAAAFGQSATDARRGGDAEAAAAGRAQEDAHADGADTEAEADEAAADLAAEP